MIESYEELKAFLSSKNGLRMSHIYKPVMLLTVLGNGGSASKRQVAQEFILGDTSTIDYFEKKIVHNMPGSRLVRDGLLAKSGDVYSLDGVWLSSRKSRLMKWSRS